MGEASFDLVPWPGAITGVLVAPTASGQTVRYLIEGRLEGLGSHHRVMAGTWRQGELTGDSV